MFKDVHAFISHFYYMWWINYLYKIIYHSYCRYQEFLPLALAIWLDCLAFALAWILNPTLERWLPSFYLIRHEPMRKSTTSLVNQTSGTLSPLVIPYMAWRGRLSFQSGTLQAKNDYKCNTWSKQKLSPH